MSVGVGVGVGVGAADRSGLGDKFAAVGAGLVTLVVLLAGAAGAGIASLLGSGGSAPSPTATSQIPPDMLTLYQEAASTCPGLPWTVLAAIGTVESDNGQSTLPGVRSGVNFAGVASGPMQFLPSTFAAYDEPVPLGGVSPPDIYDPTDAVYAAARMLCANGAANGANLNAAVFAYNHSDSYVAEVLALAQSYGQAQAQTVAAGTAGGIAVDWALAQVGTPYIWGGETPGSASTAPAWCKPPTRWRASPCPGWPRTSSTRVHYSRPVRRSNRATSSSSEDPARRSATLESTSAPRAATR